MLFPKSYEEDSLLEAALEAGADDLADNGEAWKITCGPSELHEVKEAIEAAGFTATTAEPALEPTQLVPVTDEAEAKKVLRLLDAIDDLDDAQSVNANCDIPDSVLESYEG